MTLRGLSINLFSPKTLNLEFFSYLIEIRRIVLAMSSRKIRTSFEFVKYLNLFVLCILCLQLYSIFHSSNFERDRLLYYKLNDCKWSVSCVHCCWPRCLGAGVSPPLVTITSPLASPPQLSVGSVGRRTWEQSSPPQYHRTTTSSD